MCGICGLDRPDRPLVEAMTRTMTHRGPDDEGFFVDDGISLGVRRLSIIDVAGGRQPVSNEDGTIVAIMNGEIYNYREVRRHLEGHGHRFKTQSDTEVLPHLYEEYGDEGVHLLRGMFLYAVWDTRRRRLLLVRDRVGIKPCYYAETNGDLAFASEAKAILLQPAVRHQVDCEALDLYLTFGYVPGPQSLFKGISKLPPGHLLVREEGRTRVRQYWSPVFVEGEPGLEMHEAAEQFRQLFHEAVSLHLVSDVPVGALLSGGLDSSAVVSAMAKAAAGPVRTFTVGFDVPGMPDERQPARQVATYFGTDHHEVVVSADVAELLPKLIWHLDEPIADPAALPTFLLCRYARDTVPVVLTGEGSDELLGGYPRYAWFRWATWLNQWIPPAVRERALLPLARRAPLSRRRQAAVSNLLAQRDDVSRHLWWIGDLDPALKAEVLTRDLQESIGTGARSTVAAFLDEANGTAEDDLLRRLMALDVQTWLVDDVLAKVDRMSMAASVEARVPFLDHRLLEFVLGLPTSLKIRGVQGKRLLRHTMRNVLPPATRSRRKQAFTAPIDFWLRRPLRELLGDTVGSSRLHQRGWINADKVQALMTAHAAGDDRYGRPLWNLLCLELWAQTFLDLPAAA